MPIRVLPPPVAAAIAAGEVVERPASVVKELVENALDAGGRSVRVEVERGGLDLIRVTDDGCGIAEDELEAACQRHATSKLASADDLSRLTTLGFRGEALPSIIAAADVQIASRTQGAGRGAAVRFRDGKVVERLAYGGAHGTSVTVRNLFARQPARLKFLRSAASEAAQIVGAIHPYALAYPEVRFSLSMDGRRVLETTGSGELRDAATRVLGVEVAGQLLDITEPPERRQDGVRVRGLISPPALTRANRSSITVLVNRRWVQPRRLTFAVEQAYATLLMTGRHPLGVIAIDLPPADVDVNVHPTKADVRFKDERAVFGAVTHAVRQTLTGFSPIPEFDSGVLAAGRPPGAMTEAAAIESLNGVTLLGGPQPSQSPLWQTLLRPQEHEAHAPVAAPPQDSPRIPLLRVVGQTGGTYVVAEGPTGMYLIDQHAAHERVLYERLRARHAAAQRDVQGLLAPAPVELTPQQAAVLAEFEPLLVAHGFAFEPFGDSTVLLRSAPAELAGADAGRAFSALLDALAEDRGTDRDERLLKTLACHGSVRAGKTLSLEEMRELVLLLEECAAPRTCPHGRPTMIHLSAAALEREFRRR
ncbi:MAG TPA: DNA mismatch repair endonuclease MutL [Dehalococcoidia bacterium]|jgi:DNA mismatch repair protein MutL|nr:DNA mismatch repair endonuclease MutL [Dehalococcoidia bacterium]